MAGKYLAPRKNTPGCRPKGGNPIRDKRRKIITIALAVLFFLLALGLTVYPIFSSRYNEVHQSQIHTEYQDAVQALPDTAIPEAMAKAQAYNEELRSSIVQYGSYSKDSVTSAVEEYAQLLDLTGTGTMGYVHIGDSVDITNLWRTLHYSAVETKIIQPNDIDAIKIQPGRDLITLLTCHPYASGGRQRFLVICERMEEENGK